MEETHPSLVEFFTFRQIFVKEGFFSESHLGKDMFGIGLFRIVSGALVQVYASS